MPIISKSDRTHPLLIGLGLVLIALLVALLVFWLGTRRDASESYIASVAPYLLMTPEKSRWSLTQIHRRYPNEFPLDMARRFYLLDFHSCGEILQNNPSTPFPKSYLRDLWRIWATLPAAYQTLGRRVLLYPRDRVEWFDFPVLVKTRAIQRPSGFLGSVLFKLNTQNHFEPMRRVDERRSQEQDFLSKRSVVVWRGRPTGFGFGNNIPIREVSRQTLVESFYDKYPFLDIGLVFSPEQEETYPYYKKYKKPSMSINEMLRNRYILSVEGNDVATNLKWIMTSKSLVLMPTPTIESWFLEGTLRPYVHYLPVRNDFSDLSDRFHWAEAHPEECLRMIDNANKYAASFLDSGSENRKLAGVLKRYLDDFQWEG